MPLDHSQLKCIMTGTGASLWQSGSRTYEEAGDVLMSAGHARQQVWCPPKRQNLRVTLGMLDTPFKGAT